MADSAELQFILRMRDEASAVLRQNGMAASEAGAKHQQAARGAKEHADALGELAKNRVRLPGYFNALAAQVLYENSPEEFDAEQVGVDANGHGVYVLFWRTPQRGLA